MTISTLAEAARRIEAGRGAPSLRRSTAPKACRRRWGSIPIVFVLAVAAGCDDGGPGYPCVTFSGEVTVAGRPLESGSMQFVPVEGDQGPTVGAVIENGQYHASNVPLGKVHVLFTAIKQGKQVGSVEDIPVFETIQLIPEPYRQGVEIEVSEDTRRHDFAM